VHQLKK
jgi:hypothetical protein